MKVKNWHEFQHFKDRRPPWIKLHRGILDQRDINAISDRSFRVLVGLWLLASEDKEMDGGLPPLEDIAFRLRLPGKVVSACIDELSSFLIQDDISAISPRYHSDEPETEKRQRREETEYSASGDAASGEYVTRKKRKLTGKRLQTFNRFWKAFAYPKGKAEAADAWLDIPSLTDALVETICKAAEREAKARKDLIANGKTPKMAQGWISGRRWEDEQPNATVINFDELMASEKAKQGIRE